MNRSAAMIVLMLSILMPLQVMAEVLLSVSPCPMEMDDTEHNETMPCCPDKTELSNTNSCKTTKTCHLCKTPGQIYLPATTVFASLTDRSILAKQSLLHPAEMNPASIWRPPSFS